MVFLTRLRGVFKKKECLGICVVVIVGGVSLVHAPPFFVLPRRSHSYVLRVGLCRLLGFVCRWWFLCCVLVFCGFSSMLRCVLVWSISCNASCSRLDFWCVFGSFCHSICRFWIFLWLLLCRWGLLFFLCLSRILLAWVFHLTLLYSPFMFMW